MSRRRFLAWGAVAAGGVVAANRVFAGTDRVLLSEVDLPVPGLPAALDGLRIAHLSDTHLPGNVAAVESALALLEGLRPDLVVYTGDIFERASGLAPAMEFAGAGGRMAQAAFAILGNWEYAARVDRRRAENAYERAGVELLVNRGRVVRLRGARLNIAGLDDLRAGRPDPAAALVGLDPEDPTIWLEHEPAYADAMPAIPGRPPALILSGHTHGGQVRIPGMAPPILPSGSGRFISGLYRDTPGPLYVSRGIGTTVVPVRLACPPELPVITLRHQAET